MIPKIIHYIWFGKNPYPPKIQKCIESWKRHLPDYRIMLWNEDSFPIDKACLFVREAYNNKQYAFVSDYVRFYALYNYGGIYLDTDVEVIKAIDEKLLQTDTLLVLDDGGFISGSTIMSVQGSAFIKDSMEYYHNISFVLNNGKYNNEVINTHMQNRLYQSGYKRVNTFQKLYYNNQEVAIFPDEYFHVRSLLSGKLNITQNSYAIHWHTILWTSRKTRIINFLRLRILIPILGKKIYTKLTTRLKNGKTTI